MNIKKMTVSLALASAMTLTAVTAASYAETTTVSVTMEYSAAKATEAKSYEFDYARDGDSYTISGYKGKSENIIIPSKINGKPVSTIKSMGNSTTLKSVTIPSCVDSIWGGAFDQCSSLESIKVDSKNENYFSKDGVLFTNIFGDNCLYAYPCNRKGTTYTVPSGVEEINHRAFSGTKNLQNLKIPSSVKNMSGSCFADSESLRNITVDKKNKSFYSKNGVLFQKYENYFNTGKRIELIAYPTGRTNGKYTIPDGVNKIDIYAFSGCKKIKSVSVPDSVKDIGGSAFLNCTNLKKIVLSKNLSSIDPSTFEGCSSLESITVPETATMIGYDAFSGCTSLKNVELPSTLTLIGPNAFSCCCYVKVTYKGKTYNYDNIDKLLKKVNK